MKKTAITIEIEKIEARLLYLKDKPKSSEASTLRIIKRSLEKAKTTEREQIEEAYTTGKSNLYTITGKDYYQKTYTNEQ